MDKMGENPAQATLLTSSLPQTGSMHTSAFASYASVLDDDEVISPWRPPQPTPADRFQPLTWGTSQLFLSVGGASLRKSASSGVFERLTSDTNRRTTAKRRVEDFRAKQEAQQIPKAQKAPKAKAEEVYRRLIRDTEMRLQVAKRTSAEPVAKSPRKSSPRLPSPQETDLLNRLAADARRRSESQQKQQQDLEEKAMEEAVRLANLHHPPRARDPAVQQRLESQRFTPAPDPPAQKKTLSAEESKLLLMRLTATNPPTQDEKKSPEKITPKQAEELVNRLYAGRKRADTAPRPVVFRKQTSPLPRGSTASQQRRASVDTLEQLLAEAEQTVRSQSPRDSLSVLEDIDDMLLRIKSKAVPQSLDSAMRRPQLALRPPQSSSAEPHVPSLFQQPSMSFPLKSKSDLSDQEIESPKKSGLNEMSQSGSKPPVRVRRQGDILTKPPKVSPRLALEEARTIATPSRHSLDLKSAGFDSHNRFVTGFDEVE